MPRARIAMHSIEEILSLRHECGCSQREIARSCGLSAGTVNKLLQLAGPAGLSWPLPPELDEAASQQRLYGRPAGAGPSARREAIDFAALHKELIQRKHLTLMLLWQEYREQHGDGHSYSQFCELYRQWKSRQDPVMGQEHKAGERLFVDYAGQTVAIEEATGQTREAVIFVATLGAIRTSTPKPAGARMWRAGSARTCMPSRTFGGVPEILVPDNLKSGVTKACRYEPVLNRSYKEMARHYGVAIVPARAYRPKDKSRVSQCTSS